MKDGLEMHAVKNVEEALLKMQSPNEDNDIAINGAMTRQWVVWSLLPQSLSSMSDAFPASTVQKMHSNIFRLLENLHKI